MQQCSALSGHGIYVSLTSGSWLTLPKTVSMVEVNLGESQSHAATLSFIFEQKSGMPRHSGHSQHATDSLAGCLVAAWPRPRLLAFLSAIFCFISAPKIPLLILPLTPRSPLRPFCPFTPVPRRTWTLLARKRETKAPSWVRCGAVGLYQRNIVSRKLTAEF